jgi:hypothetical protein
MSRSWKTMRILRENPEFERHHRNGLRGIQVSSWQRPDTNLDEWLLSRDRYKDRVYRPVRSRVGAA